MEHEIIFSRLDADTVVVWFDGKRIKPEYSLKLRNHSPTGFEFGYGGSGPAQLSLAVMLEACARLFDYAHSHHEFADDLFTITCVESDGMCDTTLSLLNHGIVTWLDSRPPTRYKIGERVALTVYQHFKDQFVAPAHGDLVEINLDTKSWIYETLCSMTTNGALLGHT